MKSARRLMATFWPSRICEPNAGTPPHRLVHRHESWKRRATRKVRGVIPYAVVADHHQPDVKAVATTCPGALHTRTGLQRAPLETTKAIERSHVRMRDRLRNSRGLKRTEDGTALFERLRSDTP